MELLLLLCLCVSTWTGITSADENGVVTVTVSQGSDAILPCSPTTKEDLSFKSFKWRKDGQNVFHYDAGIYYNNGLRGQDPQFKDRVSFFEDQLRSGDASIQIQNVTIQDSGIYSCEISGLDSGSQTFNIKLVVNVQTGEGSDVILPCSPSGKNNLTYQVFDWEKDDEQQVFLYHNGKYYNNGLTGQHENFKNRVEFFQDQLQFGNASIRIKNTKLTDSGNYSCTFPLLQPPGQKFYMKLVVHVCPKPIITIKKTADGIRVICSVPDVSKVEMEMELHNSDNRTVYKPVEAVTSQNPQDFMFSVTKEDNYRCLVKQNEFCHQLYSEEIFVPVFGGRGRPAIHITREQMDFLLAQGHTVKRMANIFGCSASFLYKKSKALGVPIRGRLAAVTDEDLETNIRQLQSLYPNSGTEMMRGLLHAQGLVVPRRKVREMMARINPMATARRWSSAVTIMSRIPTVYGILMATCVS